jgi:Cdc6-like AAA superfamily ATPase
MRLSVSSAVAPIRAVPSTKCAEQGFHALLCSPIPMHLCCADMAGCPGVGKTTALRDICRLLSEESNRRVVVVDTSNEIGGDGDIPHNAGGSTPPLLLQLCTQHMDCSTASVNAISGLNPASVSQQCLLANQTTWRLRNVKTVGRARRLQVSWRLGVVCCV